MTPTKPSRTPTPSPEVVSTATPTPTHVSINRISIVLGLDAVSPSVEARIYDSDVVARATLLSVESSSLHFSVIEYLKGTGPSVVTVNANPSLRKINHDNREAVLFLKQDSSGASEESGEFVFTDTHYTSSGYTVDTLDPTWLPSEAGAGGVSGGAGSGSGTVFITDSGTATGGAQETVSLSDLRTKIAWIEGGEDIEGYDHCIARALNNMQFHRDYEVYHGKPWIPHKDEVSLISGTAAGTVVGDFGIVKEKGYGQFWLAGEDAVHFSALIVDDNEIASDGSHRRVATARPLS